MATVGERFEAEVKDFKGMQKGSNYFHSFRSLPAQTTSRLFTCCLSDRSEMGTLSNMRAQYLTQLNENELVKKVPSLLFEFVPPKSQGTGTGGG